MKIPKVTHKYCPHCKAHTEQKISIFKTKPRPKTRKHGLKWGSRYYFKKIKGYGGSPKPKVKPIKTSKKVALVYACVKCKKKYFRRNAIHRTKKVEQV